jgi:hypothetical protein
MLVSALCQNGRCGVDNLGFIEGFDFSSLEGDDATLFTVIFLIV